jgi:hypothetical protein
MGAGRIGGDDDAGRHLAFEPNTSFPTILCDSSWQHPDNWTNGHFFGWHSHPSTDSDASYCNHPTNDCRNQ